jgi:hypothetical protein
VSTITGLAPLTEGDILYHEDVRIDTRQNVHAGDGIEELENIKKRIASR